MTDTYGLTTKDYERHDKANSFALYDRNSGLSKKQRG